MSLRGAQTRMLRAGAARLMVSGGALALLLGGCALAPLESDDASSSPRYGGSYGGYGGSSVGRDEYRGPLPPGSYTESCRDMRVDHDRRELEAECRRLDGGWRQTSVDLRACDRGIVNNNGHLECPRQQLVKAPPGSYRESCRDISLDGRQLSARCRRKNGEWRDSQLDTSRCRSPIRNDDGRLTCS
jgi:CVNH domain